ncbi:MAG TPA: DUF948 domain-containing protein [Candidatus Limosilactobacillus merdigallinarum]|uniref:DUF948 domain-containing protein n=1 Tax=Candidatus Limosilactobacillus merdigallinarum TaxID=2838652 RepID=A0A9D1VI17_9LACO|nr:DUF948 domain-containing protein [Candidatus Limosilactobacillus merdigallinarum]
MTTGEIAALIAAIAFLILVIWIGWFLSKTVKSLNTTVSQLSKLTDDADNLSKELEDVLSNTNQLLADVNDKAEKLDPAIQAVADVGQSVSDVNNASRQLVEKINSRANSRSSRMINGLSKMAFMMAGHFRNKRNERKEK